MNYTQIHIKDKFEVEEIRRVTSMNKKSAVLDVGSGTGGSC